MVLWEITLATAYFLGLKRTYRLALKVQRRIISPKHPKIRQFVKRRTRVVFDFALNVHQNIQHRDIEVGRNLGNWILRWLDRMKPSAQIRVNSPKPINNVDNSITKQSINWRSQKSMGHFQSCNSKTGNKDSDRHLFASSRNLWSAKPFPTIALMMQPIRPVGSTFPYRHFYSHGYESPRLNFGGNRYGVFRKDIMQYLSQN